MQECMQHANALVQALTCCPAQSTSAGMEMLMYTRLLCEF